MLFALGPAHLGNMYQAFNARFKLHKYAVVRDAYNTALHTRTLRKTRRDRSPRIGQKLPATERDAHLLAIKFQNLDFQLFARTHDVGRIGHPAPGKIGDVQQSVDTAQIDEHTV